MQYFMFDTPCFIISCANSNPLFFTLQKGAVIFNILPSPCMLPNENLISKRRMKKRFSCFELFQACIASKFQNVVIRPIPIFCLNNRSLEKQSLC
jgi:hypothetical protein